MKKYFIGLAIFLCASNSYADWISDVDITWLGVWETVVDVKVSGSVVNEGCGSTNYYRLDTQNDVGARDKLATLLAAYMGGKKVHIFVGGCVGSYANIRGVILEP